MTIVLNNTLVAGGQGLAGTSFGGCMLVITAVKLPIIQLLLSENDVVMVQSSC